MARAPRGRRALPGERGGGIAVSGPGGVRPTGRQRQLRVARGAARRAAPGVESVSRQAVLALAAVGSLLACAEWAGPELGGPRLSLVPILGSDGREGPPHDLAPPHVLMIIPARPVA